MRVQNKSQGKWVKNNFLMVKKALINKVLGGVASTRFSYSTSFCNYVNIRNGGEISKTGRARRGCETKRKGFLVGNPFVFVKRSEA